MLAPLTIWPQEQINCLIKRIIEAQKIIRALFERKNRKDRRPVPKSDFPRIEEPVEDSIIISDNIKDVIHNLKKVSFKPKEMGPQDLSIKNVNFKKCIFNHRTIKSIRFHHCIFESCLFTGTIIQNCEFHSCSFHESCFYKTKIFDTYIDPSSFIFGSDWHIKWANINAWWFQNLYQNSKNLHQEDFAMIADREFQFYRRYEYLFGTNRKRFRFWVSVFYDVVLGYGYGIWNVLIFTCIFVAAFAFLMHQGTNLWEDCGVAGYLYFSIVSFTTVGYGDVTPLHTTLDLSITTLFLFLSVIWGALTTAVVVKRLVK